MAKSDRGWRVLLIDDSPAVLKLQAETLAEAGYELYESDRISPPLGTLLSADTAVTVERGMPVTIEADGGAWVSRTRQTSVSGLLGNPCHKIGGPMRLRQQLALTPRQLYYNLSSDVDNRRLSCS